MKNFKLVGLAALLSVGLAACGTEETPKVVNDAKVVETTEKVDKPKPEPKQEEKETMKPIVVADDEAVKITLTDIVYKEDVEYEDYRWQVKYEIENKTDLTVEVQSGTVSVDDKMVDESLYGMSQEIASGKKADAVMEIQNYDDPKDLPEFKDNLEMTLNVFDWDYKFDKEYKVVVDMSK